MKKPHLILHFRPGTHAGPWWWVELEDGRTTSWYANSATALVIAWARLRVSA